MFSCSKTGHLYINIVRALGKFRRTETVPLCVGAGSGKGSGVTDTVSLCVSAGCWNGSRVPTLSPCVFVPGSGIRSGNPVLPHPILVSGLLMLLVSLLVLLAVSLNTSNGAVLLLLSYTFVSQKDFIQNVWSLKKCLCPLYINM